jgi:four helix bundle protein
MRDDKENLIVRLSFEFAKDIIAFTEQLEDQKKFNLANQLFRSGTSIGANVKEAQNAESKNDFIHKIKLAAKEADETEYWLMLCRESKNYPDCESLIQQISSIIRILSKIIATAKTSANLQIFKSSNQEYGTLQYESHTESVETKKR